MEAQEVIKKIKSADPNDEIESVFDYGDFFASESMKVDKDTEAVSKFVFLEFMNAVKSGDVIKEFDTEGNLKIRMSDRYNELTRDFLSLFYENAKEEGLKSNVFFSPLSIITAIGMLLSAVDGKAKKEIMAYLGKTINLDDLYDLQRMLEEDGGVNIANAIVLNKSLGTSVNPNYKECFIDEYKWDFFDSERMDEAINAWVDEKTKGMIKNIVSKQINGALLAFLNAVAFEREWKDEYEVDDMSAEPFMNADGSESKQVSMMMSGENIYLEGENYEGFVKRYKEDRYLFAAVLPKSNNTIEDVIGSMDFKKALEESRQVKVTATIPEFEYSFEAKLEDYLKKVGIREIFEATADYSPLTTDWVKVENVLHKAVVQVNRNGTKAAAVTAEFYGAGGAFMEEIKIVRLDRPFIFAIMHKESRLPIFVGVVNHLEDSDFEELDKRYSNGQHIVRMCREERDAYAKELYRSIARKTHPDISKDYEDLFEKASKAYKMNDIGKLEHLAEEVAEL